MNEAALLQDPALLLAAIDLVERKREAIACRANFAEFVRRAWQYAGTTEPLVWGWHLDAICLHLQAVADGQIRRLVINCPPGMGKSKLTSVLFPAWLWARRPETQVLCASYAAGLAHRDSVFCRELVRSDWYRTRFSEPGNWRMKADQDEKGYWANTKQGHRVSIGVGGTGQRCDGAVIDDPVDIEEAASSKAARDYANHWIGHTLPGRFNDSATGWIVMIMQRLHEGDPTAFFLSGGNVEHLFLASEFEAARRCITYGTDRATGERRELWRDPRTEAGELLFPAKFPAVALEALKKPNAMGEEGFAAQHQQRPTPAGGNLFKTKDWRFYRPEGYSPFHEVPRPTGCDAGPARELPARFDKIVISVDGTFKKTASGSFVAIHVWGASGSRRLLLDRVHDRMDYDVCERALVGERSAGREFSIGGVLGRWADYRECVVEDKANGSMLVNRLVNVLGIPRVIAEPVGNEGKEQRASVYLLPYHRAGNLELPEGAPYLGEFISEHAAFPKGEYNDDVDAGSQAQKHIEAPQSTADVILSTKW